MKRKEEATDKCLTCFRKLNDMQKREKEVECYGCWAKRIEAEKNGAIKKVSEI